MRIPLLFLISVLIVDVACSPERRAPKSTAAIEPDNSRRNVRDRNEKTKTAENQSENEADRRISQNIRAVLRADDSLSWRKKVRPMTRGSTAMGGKICGTPIRMWRSAPAEK